MKVINVSRDFTMYPSGRYARNGNTSGEAFREKLLVPAWQSGEPIKVDLDGTIGYGSSFLEEAFGGLVRSTRQPADRILERLEIVSADQGLIDEIKQYIRDASKELHLTEAN